MKYDVAIIGCGVTGAAAAYFLSSYNISIVILEAENDIADGTTKANSGLFHAGYDPEPGTQMADLNTDGTQQAKEICKILDVPVKWCGSLVVGFTSTDSKTIRKLYNQGIANKVHNMEIINSEKIHMMEPKLSPDIEEALLAPTAGVVSPWEYTLAMAETAVRNGTLLKRNFKVTSINTNHNNEYIINAENGKSVHASYVVNAAGLYSDVIHNFVSKPAFKITPQKGEYYIMDKNYNSIVQHIIFQCPTNKGKGVLVSPTAHGNLLIGPNSITSEKDDTSCTEAGLSYIAKAAKKSVPSLNMSNAIRSFAGIRANSTIDDFIIGEAENAKGFIDLAGIKSPGLSSAAAIAKKCVLLLEKSGLILQKKKFFINTRKRIKIADLTPAEKQKLIHKNPLYGKIICRCETITEGEIIDALQSPIPPVSIDGIKRRCNTGMGRCQGGFCSPRIMDILINEVHINYKDLLQDKTGSNLIYGKTKESAQENCK